MRKPITIDAGLRVAVFKAAGSDIHTLFALFDKYVAECNAGRAQQAEFVAHELRTRLIARSIPSSVTMSCYSRWVTTRWH